MCGYKKLYCICFEKLWPEFSQNSTTKSRHRKFPNINFKFCKGACLPIDYVQKLSISRGCNVRLPYKVFFTKNDYSSTNFHDNIFKINSPYASRKLYSTIFHRSDGLINFQVCLKRLLNSLFSSIGLL